MSKYTNEQQARIDELKKLSKTELAMRIVDLEAAQAKPQRAIVTPRALVRRATDNDLQQAYRQGALDYASEMDPWYDNIIKPYGRAIWTLLSFPSLIASLLRYPDRRFVSEIMQGKSNLLATYINEFTNKSNALLASVTIEDRSEYDIKRSEFIELAGLLTESIGRVENATNDTALDAAIKDVWRDLKPLTGSIYDELENIRASLDRGGNKGGAKQYTKELYQEWLAVEQEHPDWTHEDVHFELLNRYTERDSRTHKRSAKPGLSPRNLKKAESLMTKTAKQTPADYAYKLKKRAENANS